jgi:glycosyltransferase involved in cell wall biosynthesis
MLKNFTISAVVPAYNEELLIGKTLTSIPKFVDKIYVIDDGSKDNTCKEIEGCTYQDPRIHLIKHDSNNGVGAAIVSGYKQSLKDNIDISVVLAGDDQMDPNQIPHLVEPIIVGRAHYTKGNRLLTKEYREGMSRFRFIGNSILTFITKIASGYWQLMDPQNGYTAISKKALKMLDLDKIFTYYGYCNDILVKLNIFSLRIEDVPIPARYANEKSSIKYIPYMLKVSWMLLKNFFYRLKMKYMILSFNPLVLFYFLGLLITPISIGLGIFSLYYKFVLGGALFMRGVLSFLLFIIGMQFLFFAMLFDMQMDTSSRINYND